MWQMSGINYKSLLASGPDPLPGLCPRTPMGISVPLTPYPCIGLRVSVHGLRLRACYWIYWLIDWLIDWLYSHALCRTVPLQNPWHRHWEHARYSVKFNAFKFNSDGVLTVVFAYTSGWSRFRWRRRIRGLELWSIDQCTAHAQLPAVPAGHSLQCFCLSLLATGHWEWEQNKALNLLNVTAHRRQTHYSPFTAASC